MIINFTNHPSSVWGREQLAAAALWGDIVDIPFPDVPAAADENDIRLLADSCCAKLCGLDPDAVLVQGEMSLSFAVAEQLCKNGITVLCAASERVCETSVNGDGSTVKRSIFKFVRFRRYGG